MLFGCVVKVVRNISASAHVLACRCGREFVVGTLHCLKRMINAKKMGSQKIDRGQKSREDVVLLKPQWSTPLVLGRINLSRNCGGCHWCSICSRLRRYASLWARCISIYGRCAFSLGLWAVAADMSGLTASIAGLTSLVQWSTVRSLAIAADVSKFATGVALHGLSLAIPSEMVWPTALVACRSAIVPNEASAVSTSVTSTWRTSRATSSWGSGWSWAVALHLRYNSFASVIPQGTYC